MDRIKGTFDILVKSFSINKLGITKSYGLGYKKFSQYSLNLPLFLFVVFREQGLNALNAFKSLNYKLNIRRSFLYHFSQAFLVLKLIFATIQTIPTFHYTSARSTLWSWMTALILI